MTQNAHGLALPHTRAHLGLVGSMAMLRCMVSRPDVWIMSAMNCCASSTFDRSGHRSSMVTPDRARPSMTCL